MIPTTNLKQGSDYYLNLQGLVVLTSQYLLKRGQCCLSACLHCPYATHDKINPDIPSELQLGSNDEGHFDLDNN